MHVSVEQLDRLRFKYREIADLRDAHIGGSAEDPRPRMRALAAEFPGALRELDQLRRESIAERIDALESVLTGREDPRTWMVALIHYHRTLALVLRMRRELGSRLGSGTRDWPGARDWLRARGPTWSESTIRLLAAPPEGRLNRCVCELIESELELAPGAVDVWLGGRSEPQVVDPV